MIIYVVAHKAFSVPADLPPFYRPIQVGAALNSDLGFLRDDIGDNISDRNGSYNELTALYWIWKNSNEDIVGLCHYRRYFIKPTAKIKNLATGEISGFLQRQDILKMLERHDIIVHNSSFFSQGVRRQFEQTQNAEHLAVLERMVCASGPQYADAFTKVMDGKKIHLLNMFIARKAVADRYAAWLFPILEATEREIIRSDPSADMHRAMGMLAERLPDVWLRANRMRVKECFTLNTERIDRTPW